MANINIYGTLVRDVDYNTPSKIVRGYQVEGGYFVCENLPEWGDIGQLCYCSTDQKFYQYLPITEQDETTIIHKWINLDLKNYINKLLFESEFIIDSTGIGEPPVLK